MTDFVDSAGKRLADYPRPSIAVDTSLLTIDPEDGLSILLVRRPGEAKPVWALPGTFLREGERLADAVRRSLRDKAGVTGLEPQQLTVLDDPKRDDRGWVLSVAHLETVSFDELQDATSGSPDIAIKSVSALPRLAFDHREVVRLAVETLREQYDEKADPRRLLDEPFTLAQLQQLHEAVAGAEFQKDTFRRQMEPQLRATGDTATGVVGRPARLFVRR